MHVTFLVDCEYCIALWGKIFLPSLTHPSLFLKELFQLFLLTGQLQLHVLTARQKPLIVLQCRDKRHKEKNEKEEEDVQYLIEFAKKRNTCLTPLRSVPAAQSCLFHFLFAAPFPHKEAGSHHRALLLSCMDEIQM